MARTSKKATGSKKSSNQGYGIHNVCKIQKKPQIIKEITKKKWKDVSSIELYKLFQLGWSSEKIQKIFNVSLVSVLNRLRF